ncbi:MAG: hypothetical protein MUE72_04630, partial [Chitinophagaceae bacterium]|nr:hypothetical protein [Chitinophagaceae bacterium]
MMKKVITLLAFSTVLAGSAQAQSILNKAKTVAAASGFDVNSLTQSVTSQLTSKLGLSATQVPKVTNAVTTFMQAKSAILPLLKTNKNQYQTKQSEIFGNLKTALTGVLLKNQMNKFLGLKPTTNDPTNVLSN